MSNLVNATTTKIYRDILPEMCEPSTTRILGFERKGNLDFAQQQRQKTLILILRYSYYILIFC